MDDLSNDVSIVRIHGEREEWPNNAAQCLSVMGETLQCSYWADEETLKERAYSLQELADCRFRVTYFFQGQTLFYSSLLEAALDTLGLVRFRVLAQKVFDRNLKLYNNRMGFLRRAVDLYLRRIADQENQESPLDDRQVFTMYDFLVDLYGERIRNSEQLFPAIDHARFMIDSWVQSEELEFVEGYSTSARFRVTPKAAATIASHELEMRKHRDSLLPAWIAAFAAVVAIIVSVTLWLFAGANGTPTS